MTTLQDALAAQSNSPAQSSPFYWLFFIAVPTEPDPSAFRFTSNTTSVTFGTSDLGIPHQWKPMKISFDSIEQDSEGSLPTVNVTVSNAKRILQGSIEEYDWLLGQPVQIILVQEDALGNQNAKMVWDLDITSSSMSYESVTFALSAESLYTKFIPNLLFSLNACTHVYGDGDCQFDIEGLDPGLSILGECDLSLSACKLRGDEEVADGRERLHPLRYGAEPAFPLNI